MQQHSREQRGAALMLILLLLVVAGSTLALSAMNSNPALHAQRQRDLHQQMQRAKDALLAYAAHSATLHGNARGPGFLPCPATGSSDPDNDGITSENDTTDCAGYAAAMPLVGRLPIALDAAGSRYELNAYDAGIDQRFWYAVGNRYVAISSATAATSVLRNAERRTSTTLADATEYRLTLDGTPGYVAMIIAPGEALAWQNRPGAATDHNNYLEQINGDGYAFISQYPTDPAALNDQLLGITLDEYMRAVGIHVVLAMKKELDVFYASNGDRYPASPGYVDFPAESLVPGSQDEFLAVFYGTPAAGNTWLRSDANAPPEQGNSENWPSVTHYLQINPAQAMIAFKGCEGMVYTVDHVGGIARAGNSC